MGSMVPGSPNFFETFMQSYLAGQQMRRQREQEAQQQEERKLRLETLKFEQNRIKLEDKIRAAQMNRQGSLDTLKMFEGLPQPSIPLPEGIPGPPQPTGPTSLQIPGINIPEAGIHVPGVEAPVRYQADVEAMLSRQREMQMMDEIRKAAGISEAQAQGAANVAQRPREVPGLPVPVPGDLADNFLSLLGQQTQQRGQQDFQRSQSAEARAHDLRMEGVRAGNARTLEQERRAAARVEEANKPLSGEAAKVLSVAQTVVPEVEQLKEAFSKDYQRSVRGIVSGTDRRLVKLVDQVADKVGRLRSGGAINKDEEARFKRQIASLPDLAFGDPQNAIQALDGIITEAQQVAGSIRPQRTSVDVQRSPAPRLTGNAPRAQNAQGQTIEWNGTAWVPVR